MFAKSKTVSAVSLALCVALVGLVGTASAEQNNGSGPTQAQIDCQNRAVNDYWDQVKACDQNLSDLPADNQMCKDDARADLSRRKSACTAAIVAGGNGSTVLGTSGVLDTGGASGGMTLQLQRLPGKITKIGVLK